MKKCMLSLAAAALALYVSAQTEPADSADGFKFNDIYTVKTTSVKDQNKSGTCWCFAGTSFIEDEIMRMGGDSLDLSEMYTVRNCYSDKADKYVRMNGQANFAAGGGLHDLGYSWQKYGIVPQEVYQGLEYGEDNHEHAELDALLLSYVQTVAKKPNKKLSTSWKKGYDAVLDAYFGPMPESFEYKGKTYTPQSYAQSLGINFDDYIQITSFTHHPFYESFILEIPDNWVNGLYYNVPIDQMKAVVDNAVSNGYSVLWAADVSEPGFKWREGVALIPAAKDESDLEGTELARWVKLSAKDKESERYNFTGPVEEIVVTQQSRQDMFDSQETTDDHAMVIVGIAEDQEGNRYYKVKNSWTDNQVYGGYIYVSEPYFLAKTTGLMVHKGALPAQLAQKINGKSK